jgi:hypothetical protein
MPNYDQWLEKHYHPENFEDNIQESIDEEFNRNTDGNKMLAMPTFKTPATKERRGALLPLAS